jgi:glycyl-tRNA synthetase beta chain
MRGTANENKFTVRNFDEYKKFLKENYVILSFEERKIEIVKRIKEIEKEYEFHVPVDKDLLDTVANLVEYPFAVLGNFEKDFLQLPDDVLITSMKVHQKYFFVKDKNGNLLNFFIGISNTLPVSDNIKNGYERVLRARLTDAMFFFENDKKIPLEKRSEELKKVVYQEKLGTSWEKVERFTKIAEKLTDFLDKSKLSSVKRAALLSKADLMTEMVYEFPELQGYMGMVYAKIQGETEDIANAIFEHYFPRFAGDKLPTTFEGTVISIADKLDTICGCFVIGLIPTGNNDPYGLRRGAIGILNIIREKNIRLDIKKLISFCLNLLDKKVDFNKDETLSKIYEFIMQRFKQILINEGADADIFDALVDNFEDILTIEKAVKEVTPKRVSEDFMIVTTSYKRIANILKKSGGTFTKFDISKINNKFEEDLYLHLKDLDSKLDKLIENEKFQEAIELLLSMRKPVDDFFDNILVMDNDEEIRNNRLALLSNLKSTFDKLLRFDKIN